MKILFAIVVLIAVVYLLLPKDELQRLAQFLPQHQIEQAAETVLSDVDQKLEQFKTKLSSTKDIRLNKLEEQLATLQAKFVAQEEKYTLAVILKNEQALQRLSEEKRLTTAEYLAAEPLLTHPKPPVGHNIDLSIKETNKQQKINRQAYLQDLVDRMNKTSLLTLTN